MNCEIPTVNSSSEKSSKNQQGMNYRSCLGSLVARSQNDPINLFSHH
jgi:hypothetical protein